MSSTTAASFAFSIGSINPLKPSSMARIAIGSTPLIGLRLPSRESSPIITYLSSMALLICSDAANIAMAMGRS